MVTLPPNPAELLQSEAMKDTDADPRALRRVRRAAPAPRAPSCRKKSDDAKAWRQATRWTRHRRRSGASGQRPVRRQHGDRL